jgi:hypothetical protein
MFHPGGPPCSRRELLRRSGLGLGSLALTWLLGEEGRLSAADGQPVRPLKANGKARHVILIHHGGGLSHVDSWDPKPALAKLQGKDVPESIARRVPPAARLRLKNLYPSPFAFRRHGRSGIEVSDLFPALAERVDDLCVIRSMHHTSVVHTPADYLALTGSFLGTRPSLGAWITYGLGSDNRNLPAFVNLVHGEHFSGPAVWSAGFLPAQYQGTTVNARGGLPDVGMPAGFTPARRRAQLDLLGDLNRFHHDRHGDNTELEARIAAYEMAFRMQTAAPEAFDLAGESAATQKLYGLDVTASEEFGRNCLLARRLVERGVRFVQLIQAGWDAHGDLAGNHRSQARIADRPIAGLLADLKARGLLDHTLIVCGGEFGRTPTVEGDPKKPGRDHSPTAYSVWLAGGGVKGGQVVGKTDDIGYTVAERPVHPNDLHATILAALGVDQHELYYRHHNRKEIMTFNGGEVVKEVFA